MTTTQRSPTSGSNELFVSDLQRTLRSTQAKHDNKLTAAEVQTGYLVLKAGANGVHMDQAVEPRKGRRPPVPHPMRERAYARPAVLAAARKLFDTECYTSLSLERIAAKAGVSRYTVNKHFESKSEIFKLSREELLAEAVELIGDAIPERMETLDGIRCFLDNAFEVFSSAANLELMSSIKREGELHSWLVDAHQKKIRCRLIQQCETFLLYHIDRSDDLFADTRLLAEQLTVLAESVAYGPYLAGKCDKTGLEPTRAKKFSIAAKAAARLVDANDKQFPAFEAISLDRPCAQRAVRR
jgi:AcrR family transcriptional regulator